MKVAIFLNKQASVLNGHQEGATCIRKKRVYMKCYTRQNWAFLKNQKIGLKMDQVEPEDKQSK